MNLAFELNKVLDGYGVLATCVDAKELDHFQIFYLRLQPGCRIRSIEALAREIQLAMHLDTTPVFISDGSSGLVQMVSARKSQESIFLEEVMQSKNGKFNCELGIDSFGDVLSIDITQAPHLLVAGTTGSGKSVFLHVLIGNMQAMGKNNRIILADPKHVEFEGYKEQKNTNVIEVLNDYIDIVEMLEWMEEEMNKRYDIMSRHGCRDISETKAAGIPMNRWFVIIDEVADIMAQDKDKRFQNALCRIAQKSRAVGIHLVIATQRPSVDVISGLIKANFPVRVVFKVPSSTDSRVIIDQNGAENLLGKGDGFLYGFGGRNIVRFKSAFITAKGVVANSNRPILRLVV